MPIEVFYEGRIYRTNAKGTYDPDTGELTVIKGSIVSETVKQFQKTSLINKLREQYTDENGVLLQSITFDNPSLAASFVSGYSSNGLLTWHIDKHRTLRDMKKS